MFARAPSEEEGQGVSYSLHSEDGASFVFIAALERHADSGERRPVERYRVTIDRRSGAVAEPPAPIALSERQLRDAVLAATGQRL
jgi:hypothetical protein